MAAVGQKLGKTSKSWNATSDVLAPIIVVIDLRLFGHLLAPPAAKSAFRFRRAQGGGGGNNDGDGEQPTQLLAIET
jgi:hypothetical protein